MQVIKNYLYNAWYQIFIILVPLITTPYISRVLGAQAVGINAYTNSIIQMFAIIVGLGINLYGNREVAYARGDKSEQSQIFWEVEGIRLVMVVIGMLTFMFYLATQPRYATQLELQSLLILATGADISWFFMGNEDFKIIVIKNAIIKVVSVLLILSLVKTSQDLNRYMLIISGSTLAGNISLWPYLKDQVQCVSWSSLKFIRHLKPSLILFIPQISSQVYLVLNKTMLGQMIGTTATGYFDNSDKVIKLILSIVTATGTVMLPHVAKTFHQGNMQKVNAYLYETFDLVTALAMPLFFGIAAIATNFAPYFFGAGFSGIDKVIMLEAPVIVIIAWSNVIGVQYLLPTNQNKKYTISVVIGAVVNIAINIPLIHTWGVLGACLATSISELAITTYQLFSIHRQVNVLQLFSSTWKYLLAGFSMFTVVFYVTMNIQATVLVIIGEVLLGAVIYGVVLWIVKAPVNKRVIQVSKILILKVRSIN